MNQHAIIIDEDIIAVTPHKEHEFTAPTAAVALGYGVSVSTIREHKRTHSDELVAGKHFLVTHNTGDGDNFTGVRNPDARQKGLKQGNDTVTHWTKRGIIRLGFFIRSERAKRFRDMAEDLIIAVESGSYAQPIRSRHIPDLIADKIAAYAISDKASVEVLDALVNLHRRITPAEEVRTSPDICSPKLASKKRAASTPQLELLRLLNGGIFSIPDLGIANAKLWELPSPKGANAASLGQTWHGPAAILESILVGDGQCFSSVSLEMRAILRNHRLTTLLHRLDSFQAGWDAPRISKGDVRNWKGWLISAPETAANAQF